MQEHDASNWFLVSRLVAALYGDAARHLENSISDREQLLILNGCRELSMPVSAGVVGTRKAIVADPNGVIRINRDVVTTCEVIGDTITAELSSMIFLRIANEHVNLYREKQLFGAKVAEVFPAAISDIEEAGKCLALGRATAGVFHLMRIMELGLKVLARPLGIPYAPS
jgi:hypothetical protein